MSLKVIVICVLASLTTKVAAADAHSTPLTVFTAREIVTMDESMPTAKAVAVADGRIVAVGTLETMEAWLDARPHEIDTRFSDKVLVPGLIDNHLHPIMAAILLGTHWITPHEWELNGQAIKRTRGKTQFLKRVAEQVEADPGAQEPFITWGYHNLWHGIIRRSDLDRISATRPIVLWQRSFHEIIVNSAGLAWLGFVPGEDQPPPDSDFDHGVFAERGLLPAVSRMVPYLMQPERLTKGLKQVAEIVHRGGITTISDMGLGAYLGIQQEQAVQLQAFGSESVPFRNMLVPAPELIIAKEGDAAALEAVEQFMTLSTDKLPIKRHVKLFADGAFFAQYMKMNPPGYIDGHQGKWLTEPDALMASIRTFWNANFQLHVHVNGDAGLDVVLNALQTMLNERPKFDHRFTLHHVGYATNDQLRRAAALGAVISAQPNYIWALGDKYAKHGLGRDRASQMSRIGGMLRAGIPVSLHSDFTMAPAAPLTLAWIATNRITAEGTLMAPRERISVQQALRAITIDAAFAMRMEHEIGSISAGKRADFTILESHPFEVEPQALKDIPIWGTVFEGRVFPLP